MNHKLWTKKLTVLQCTLLSKVQTSNSRINCNGSRQPTLITFISESMPECTYPLSRNCDPDWGLWRLVASSAATISVGAGPMAALWGEVYATQVLPVRVGPFAFRYQGNGATSSQSIALRVIPLARQLIALQLSRWEFLYNETFQQTFRPLLLKLSKRRLI